MKLSENIFFLLFFVSTQVIAIERSQIKLELNSIETSDDLKVKTTSISYRNNRRDLLWNYLGAQESALDIGVDMNINTGTLKDDDIEGIKTSLYLGKKNNFNNYTYFKLGGHKFEYDDDKSESLVYELGHFFKIKKIIAHLFLNNDYFYIDRAVTSAFSEKLKRTNLTLNATYLPKDNFRVPFKINRLIIDDKNQKSNEQLTILYGRSYPLWIWAGYGIERLSFSERKIGYWSPEKFFSHGPRFELAKSIDKVSLKLSYSYSIIKEDDFDPGKSTYLSMGLDYGDRNELLISGRFFENRSIQASNVWWAKGFKLSLLNSF